MKNKEHGFSKEEINNIKELAEALREIRARLLREGVDIEKLKEEFKKKHKKD